MLRADHVLRVRSVMAVPASQHRQPYIPAAAAGQRQGQFSPFTRLDCRVRYGQRSGGLTVRRKWRCDPRTQQSLRA